MIWLENDTKEIVSETIRMTDALCSVDPQKIEREQIQSHRTTFTCYKRPKDEAMKRCRFGAPFWPINETRVLFPMPKEDGRREMLAKKFSDIHRSLESDEFEDLNSFPFHHNIATYGNYLNVLRVGITRPRVFLKRTIKQKWMIGLQPVESR